MEIGAFDSLGAFGSTLVPTTLTLDDAWTRCAQMKKNKPTAPTAIHRALEVSFIVSLPSFEGNLCKSVPACFVPEWFSNA